MEKINNLNNLKIKIIKTNLYINLLKSIMCKVTKIKEENVLVSMKAKILKILNDLLIIFVLKFN